MAGPLFYPEMCILDLHLFLIKAGKIKSPCWFTQAIKKSVLLMHRGAIKIYTFQCLQEVTSLPEEAKNSKTYVGAKDPSLPDPV